MISPSKKSKNFQDCYWNLRQINRLEQYPPSVPLNQLGRLVLRRPTTKEASMLTKESVHSSVRYVLVKKEEKLYDLHEQEFIKLQDEQYLSARDASFLDILNVLYDYDCVMGIHPDPKSWKIFTVEDLNTPKSKQWLFPYFATIAESLSEWFNSEYTEQELQDMIGVDKNATDHFYLKTFKSRITEDKLWKSLRFNSETEFEDYMETILKTRNRIMHPNAHIARTDEELDEVVKAVEKCIDLSNRIKETMGERLILSGKEEVKISKKRFDELMKQIEREDESNHSMYPFSSANSQRVISSLTINGSGLSIDVEFSEDCVKIDGDTYKIHPEVLDGFIVYIMYYSKVTRLDEKLRHRIQSRVDTIGELAK